MILDTGQRDCGCKLYLTQSRVKKEKIYVREVFWDSDNVTAQRVKVVQIQAFAIHKNAKKTRESFVFAKLRTAAKTEYSST